MECLDSIFEDGYPQNKIRAIVVVNGENPSCLPAEQEDRDIVGANRSALSRELQGKPWEGRVTIVTVHGNVGNKAVPLNAGYSEVSVDTKVVMTIDPDGRIQKGMGVFPGSLKRLVAHFLLDRDNKVGAVGGVITTRQERIDGADTAYRGYNRYTRWEFLVSEYSTRWLRNVYRPYLYHISGGISAFRREVLESLRLVRTDHRKRKGKSEKIWVMKDGTYQPIDEVFCVDSVTEDYEITQHVLDMGKKVEHDPYATYYGGATNNHDEQWDRFRRWYGGSSQVDNHKPRLFCDSSFFSKLSRFWRAFSTRRYTYWWMFTLLLIPAILISCSILGDWSIWTQESWSLLWNPTQPLWWNVLSYTWIGTILSFTSLPDSLTFWLCFPKIYLAEVTLGWFELLFSALFGFRALNKKFGSLFDKPWGYVPCCLWLPFEIVWWNRFYWLLFSFHGRVTEKKLPW